VKQGGAWCAACLVPWSPATLVRRRGVGLGVSLMCRWEVCVRVVMGGLGRGGRRRAFRAMYGKDSRHNQFPTIVSIGGAG